MKNKELTPLDWLNHYEKIIRESHKTFRPNGFGIIETALKDAEKYKKALEIIKNKKVNVWTLLETETCAEYNFKEVVVKPKRDLTQEEYDLLKEILGNE